MELERNKMIVKSFFIYCVDLIKNNINVGANTGYYLEDK
jgi:hypothetical protein